MVLINRSSEADFLFEIEDFADEIRVLRFSGVEGISEPFRYNLKLAIQNDDIDLSAIVGSDGHLTISSDNGDRYVHGRISKFVKGGIGSRFTIYNADIVPYFWLFNLRPYSRIFQNKTIQEIMTELFQAAAVPSDNYRFELQGTHNAREYCVQYRESEFNFMSRLMEEEGIFYYFEHDDSKHIMVIADSPATHQSIESPEIPFNEPSGMVVDQEYVYEYRSLRQLRPDMVTLRDFNYLNPMLNLEIEKKAGEESEGYAVYDYPGLYQDQGAGNDITQLRLDAFRTNLEIFLGKSICRRFVPGYRFQLASHTRTSFNQEYLITLVKSTGAQPLGEDMSGDGLQYSNEFECIQSSVSYRPARKTQKPIVEGVQTAFVVGPSGDDIYFDDYGRVKVQFHWDREGLNDENSSCWVRVSDGYAGQKHGIQFTPLIGDEVIVDFLEGDPDRPIITGRVYNGDNMPHLQPQNKIQNLILTPYQHRLLFDDKGTTIILNTGGRESITMSDGSETKSDYGNNINISTADGHFIHLAQGTAAQGITISTVKKNLMVFDDKNQNITIQTENGHKIVLDDKNQKIDIKSTGGHIIEINDAAGTIVASDSAGENSWTITAGSGIAINSKTGNIDIKADSGDVNIDANRIWLNARENIDMGAGADIVMVGTNVNTTADIEVSMKGTKISSEGTDYSVKGTMVTIEASGVLTLKGSLVKIN
jgi:type VI secretion system VgrG family protein